MKPLQGFEPHMYILQPKFVQIIIIQAIYTFKKYCSLQSDVKTLGTIDLGPPFLQILICISLLKAVILIKKCFPIQDLNFDLKNHNFFHNIVHKQPRTKEIRRCLIFFHPGNNSMLTRSLLNIQILFTNYDIITDFVNLSFCSEHFISI